MAATLVNLNKVVDELLALQKNWDKKNAMSLKIAAKRTFIDLHLNIISQTKKKFVKVKKMNGFRYAEVPNDYYLFSSAAVVGDKKNLQVLSKNEFLNITEEVVEETCADRKCKTCGQVASEICYETVNFTAVTEDVVLPNDVVVKCDYVANLLTVSLAFPYNVFGIATSDGFTNIDTTVNNALELQTVLEGVGLTKVSNTKYKVTNTAVDYYYLYFIDGDGDIQIVSFVSENCYDDDTESTTYQKVTTLKTCANGDIQREVCEPVVINTAGVTFCDYVLNLSFDETLCQYSITFNPSLQECNYSFDLTAITYPITNAAITISGVTYNSGALVNLAALSAWLTTLGFTVVGTTATFNNTSLAITSLSISYVSENINIEPTQTSCDTTTNRYPYYIYGYIKNGSFVTVNTLIEDYADLVAFFVSIGFVENASHVFIKENSGDVYESITWSIYAPNTVPSSTTQVFIQSDCDDTTALVPPFTFKSYTKNLATTTINTAIADVEDLISVFADLGIFLSEEGVYTIYQSSDVWENVVITYNGTDFTFLFEQQNCFTDTTHEVINQCNTVTECNVPVKACGCIVDTPESCKKISECCGDVLSSCCTNDSIKKYANDTIIPQAPNPKGGYKFDPNTNRIYLDDYFCGDKLLITYMSDGSINGKYFIPDYAVPAAMAGIYFKSMQFDKRAGIGEKSYAERQYGKEKDKLFRELNQMNIAELAEALRVQVFYNAPLMRSSHELFTNGVVNNAITN